MSYAEKQIRDVAQLVGKTIARIDEDKALLLVFTDGTFAVFRIDCGYEPSDSMVVLDADGAQHYEARDWKLISPAEYEQLEVEIQARATARQEDRDREDYARLKQRFGVVVPPPVDLVAAFPSSTGVACAVAIHNTSCLHCKKAIAIGDALCLVKNVPGAYCSSECAAPIPGAVDRTEVDSRS